MLFRSGDATGAAITINSGATTFNSTLATASGITSAANVTFKDDVTIAAGDTATTLNGNTTFDKATQLTFTAGGNATFGDAGTDQVTLASGPVTITTAAANTNQVYNAKVDGARDLTLAAGTGTITFNAAVGGTNAIGDATGAAITINSGATTFNSTLATASGITRDRKSTRLNSSHSQQSRMPSSA